MVTTIVASLRPTLGRSLALMRSMSSMNALPIRSGPGRLLHPRPFGRGEVLGGGEGEEHLLQLRGLECRQRESAVDLPVAVVGHREPGRLGGFGFFLLEEISLVGVDQVGCDDLQQPVARGS